MEKAIVKRSDSAANELRPRPWPMWLFAATSLLLNLFGPSLIVWRNFRSLDRQIQAGVFYAGALVGECCFVVLVAGLTKRTWLGAYLFGLGLVAAGYLAAIRGFWIIGEFERELIASVALLPAFLLAAASPLYGLRHLFGWRLTVDGTTPSVRQPLLLADIFSLIAIIAALLVLIRVPQVISESEASEFWVPVVITSLILFGCGLVILPLHARVAFGNRPVSKKLMGLLLLAIVIAVSVFGIIQFFGYSSDTSWRNRLAILLFLATFLGAAFGMFYLPLLLLSASGMRLVRGYDPKCEPTEDAQQQTAHLKRVTWWRIGGAIAVTMATSIYLANLQQWRAVRDKENKILVSRARATLGRLGINDRIPSNLKLGPRATDADLAAFTTCGEVNNLYLRNAKITDHGLTQLQHFPALLTLSLENMTISDAGLVHLRHLPNLESLEIVSCHIKGSHLVDLPNKRRLTMLDLSRTQFGDEESAYLSEFSALFSLKLNRTRVTDQGLETIGRLQTLTHLELVGTDVEAERFPFPPALEYLDLSGTKANDAAVSSIARLSQLQFLSLRNTQVTTASIPSLASLKSLHHLDLSDTSIDDEAIRELGRDTMLASIDLSCTRVTGSGFADWHSHSRFNHIILDRTLTDDEGIAALMPIGEVGELALAHTKITDACLPQLAQIAINHLDIRGTQITFGGLVNNAWPRLDTLEVATGQFTPQQLAQLRRQLGIKVKVGKP